jgi:hypothetical protein
MHLAQCQCQFHAYLAARTYDENLFFFHVITRWAKVKNNTEKGGDGRNKCLLMPGGNVLLASGRLNETGRSVTLRPDGSYGQPL